MAVEITSNGAILPREEIEEVFFRCSKDQVEFYRKLLQVTNWQTNVEVKADGKKILVVKAYLEEFTGELDPAMMPWWQLEAKFREKS